MRIAAIVLLMALIVVGALYMSSKRAASRQLALASNDVAAAQRQIAEIKTQMQAKVDTLAADVEKLTGEKAIADAGLLALSNQLDAARHELRQEREKAATFARESDSLAGQVQTLTNRVIAVENSLWALRQTHATTVRHLTAMREDYVALTRDKAALEAKLRDPDALRSQLRAVKQEQHARKVEERHRLDRAETALGNAGFLMKRGQWVSAPTPGRYPLIQDIRRDL